MKTAGALGEETDRAAGSARRDDRVAELERLRQLYEIGKLLMRFQSVECTVPAVLAGVAQQLSLYDAIFIVETAGVRQVLSWQAEHQDVAQLQVATDLAHRAYSSFVRSRADRESDPIGVLAASLPLALVAEAQHQGRQHLVFLPLVGDDGLPFGALQAGGKDELEELDLVFINAVVNQLALALDRHFADGALRTSEAKLAGIVSLAADAIVSVDEAQRIVLFNEGAEKIFGWTRAEALGQPLGILLPEGLRDAHRQHIPNFSAGPETSRRMGESRATLCGLRKNGEQFPADAAISKLRVAGSWLYTAMLRDITELKHIEQDQQFLREVGTVLASTLDGRKVLTDLAELTLSELGDLCVIDLFDQSGALHRLEVMTSDPHKQELAHALKAFPLRPGSTHLSSSVLQSRRALLVPEVTPETIVSIAQSEEHRLLLEGMAPRSLMAVPLAVPGRLLGALVVASCRSGRRYGTRELHLLEEVGRRAALALESARLYQLAETAIKARDDVLSIVAHDLRNPLATVLMQAALLECDDTLPERRAQNPARTIERAARRMNRLIQDLLDVASMDAGHLSIDRTRLPAERVIVDSVEAQMALASSLSLELRLDLARELPEIWADRDRMLQVFENLIGNAAKFTPAGGQITVGALPRDGEVLFWVEDTGRGIAADDLPHLFDRFWQASKAERRGAGLGLPIVKGIVEAHGGRVWVESVLGQGSTFYSTVPNAPADSALS